MLTLDNLACRYHCLPSEALRRASTFDLYVLDLSAKWEKHKQDLTEGKTVSHGLTQDEMKQMIAATRSGDGI